MTKVQREKSGKNNTSIVMSPEMRQELDFVCNFLDISMIAAIRMAVTKEAAYLRAIQNGTFHYEPVQETR